MSLDNKKPDVSPSWLEVAKAELGTKEIIGPAANPRILEYLKTVHIKDIKDAKDEVPWCSAFVNWVMLSSNLQGTGSAVARSWIFWGVARTSVCF